MFDEVRIPLYTSLLGSIALFQTTRIRPPLHRHLKHQTGPPHDMLPLDRGMFGARWWNNRIASKQRMIAFGFPIANQRSNLISAAS